MTGKERRGRKKGGNPERRWENLFVEDGSFRETSSPGKTLSGNTSSGRRFFLSLRPSSFRTILKMEMRKRKNMQLKSKNMPPKGGRVLKGDLGTDSRERVSPEFALRMVSLVKRALGEECPFEVKRLPDECGWWAAGKFGGDFVWTPVFGDGDVWEEASVWLDSLGEFSSEEELAMWLEARGK